MTTLILRFKEKELQKFRLKKDKRMKIGRLGDNQIVIDNISVSGYHAEIIIENDIFLLKDLNSKNGTFVNQKLVTSCILNEGDCITIGKHELIFSHEDDESIIKNGALPTGIPSAAKTSFLDTAKHREMIYDNLEQIASKSHKAPLVTLQFKGKVIRKYLLKMNKDLTIGRLDENDVVIDNAAVSGKHALITLQKNDFVIKDCDSTNGTLLNDKPISTAILNDDDLIRIGKHDLVYSEMGAFEPNEVGLDPNSIPSMALPSDRTTFIGKDDLKKINKE